MRYIGINLKIQVLLKIENLIALIKKKLEILYKCNIDHHSMCTQLHIIAVLFTFGCQRLWWKFSCACMVYAVFVFDNNDNPFIYPGLHI